MVLFANAQVLAEAWPTSTSKASCQVSFSL
jgi:hypothetical protein